jgi:hypothetical protein
VKFDLYSNAGEGNDSTGLYSNGAAPTVSSVNLTGTGIDLHSGHVFNVAMSYNGSTLGVTITDTSTGGSATQSYTVNIPSLVGGNTAYLGFTGGTGGHTATQNILGWTFNPAYPAAPTGLAASASGGQVSLAWTDNATNESGYSLERSTDGLNFVVIAVLPADTASFTDATTTAGVHYFYRVRASNSAGYSLYSNTVGVTT